MSRTLFESIEEKTRFCKDLARQLNNTISYLAEEHSIQPVIEITPEMVFHAVDAWKFRVDSWREHLGLTQKEVADKMGISQPALSQIESGDTKLRPATIKKLAKVLGIPADYLV